MLGETKAGTESFGSQSFNSPGNTGTIITNEAHGIYTGLSQQNYNESAYNRINQYSTHIFDILELANSLNDNRFILDFLNRQNPGSGEGASSSAAGETKNTRSWKYQKWSKGFLGNFTPQTHLGLVRSQAERVAGGNTASQTINTQGVSAAHTDTNKGEKLYNETFAKASQRAKEVHSWSPEDAIFHETDICWICGKHLNVKTPIVGGGCIRIQTPQSEHKNPCFSMAILASGLAKIIGRQKKVEDTGERLKRKILTGEQTYQQSFEDMLVGNHKIIYQDWKLQVRAQGMSWSHAYCNNIKSQTPYMSLRHFRDQTSSKITYEYVIERNAILGSLIKIWKPNADTILNDTGQFNTLNTTCGERFFKLDDLNGINPNSVNVLKRIDNLLNIRRNEDQEQELETRYEELYQMIKNIVEQQAQGTQLPHFVVAFLNIIKRLFPLCCLLNQGSDIARHDYFAEQLRYQEKHEGNLSSFSILLRNCSIVQRIENNCLRMHLYGACTDDSPIGIIAERTKEGNQQPNTNQHINDLIDEFYNCGEDTISAERFVARNQNVCQLETIQEDPEEGSMEEAIELQDNYDEEKIDENTRRSRRCGTRLLRRIYNALIGAFYCSPSNENSTNTCEARKPKKSKTSRPLFNSPSQGGNKKTKKKRRIKRKKTKRRTRRKKKKKKTRRRRKR